MFLYSNPPLPAYQPVVSIEQVFNPPKFTFDVGLKFYLSPSLLLISQLERNDIKINGKEEVKQFFDTNPLVLNNFGAILDRVTGIFKSDYSLSLDPSYLENEEPELFLIITTNKPVEEAADKLMELDEWFIPNFYRKNPRFNVSLDFE